MHRELFNITRPDILGYVLCRGNERNSRNSGFVYLFVETSSTTTQWVSSTVVRMQSSCTNASTDSEVCVHTGPQVATRGLKRKRGGGCAVEEEER